MTDLTIAAGVDASAYRSPRPRTYARGDETRARILRRCRELMAAGTFRPLQKELLTITITRTTLGYHFASLDDLYEAALDLDTSRAIARRVLAGAGDTIDASDATRLALAAVFGRLRT